MIELRDRDLYLVSPNVSDCLVGKIVQLEDGFFYYDDLSGKGVQSGEMLKAIGEKLIEINKPWNDEIDEYFRQSDLREKENP